jgi:hypothetical protein
MISYVLVGLELKPAFHPMGTSVCAIYNAIWATHLGHMWNTLVEHV